MLNIVTALKIEAMPIIQKYNLKSIDGIYQNKFINLIITGQGKLKSAINTTYLLSQHKHKTLNIGIAGSNKYKINEGFFIDKIIDSDSNYHYYPDYFDQKSETLYTVSKPNKYYSLVDMEGSGFFEACYKFLNVEEIILYKIVSDTPHEHIKKEIIPELITNHLEIIDKLLDEKNNVFAEIEEKLNEIKQKMHITKTQENQIKHILTLYKIKNKKFPIIKELRKKEEVKEFITSLFSSLEI